MYSLLYLTLRYFENPAPEACHDLGKNAEMWICRWAKLQVLANSFNAIHPVITHFITTHADSIHNIPPHFILHTYEPLHFHILPVAKCNTGKVLHWAGTIVCSLFQFARWQCQQLGQASGYRDFGQGQWAIGKMQKCTIRNAQVKRGMKNAESYCGMVSKMRNAERPKYLSCISPVMLHTNVDAQCDELRQATRHLSPD